MIRMTKVSMLLLVDCLLRVHFILYDFIYSAFSYMSTLVAQVYLRIIGLFRRLRFIFSSFHIYYKKLDVVVRSFILHCVWIERDFTHSFVENF